MFEAIGIEKSYENRVALGGVDLHVPKGSVYGLLGPNGAGKSTLLRCLVGAYAPRKGKVLLDGQPVWENPAVKQRIAYIPDDMSAYPGSSVKEMAAMFRLLYPRFDEARFRELQEVFSFKPQASFRMPVGEWECHDPELRVQMTYVSYSEDSFMTWEGETRKVYFHTMSDTFSLSSGKWKFGLEQYDYLARGIWYVNLKGEMVLRLYQNDEDLLAKAGYETIVLQPVRAEVQP